MKTIEQKAKAYDEALKVLHKYDGANIMFTQDLKEEMFPELKESEDEKTRKELLKHLREVASGKSLELSTTNYERWATWVEKQGEHAKFRDSIQVGDKVTRNQDGVLVNLSQLNRVAKKDEKQGEQKPTPKFHESEWVVYECVEETATLQIIRIVGETYVFSDDSTLGVVDEDTLRLWDVTKDAKDGDVLATDDWVFIFKELNTNCKPVCYCHYDVDLGFVIDVNTYISTGSTIKPATKEQRNLLFQKMYEVGYVWNDDKKELKKIEYTSTWSEDDEKQLNDIIELLPDLSNRHNWLKSLKDRVGNFDNGYKVGFSAAKHNQWKPSDEQITWLYRAADDASKDSRMKQVLNNLLLDLKKLRDE